MLKISLTILTLWILFAIIIPSIEIYSIPQFNNKIQNSKNIKKLANKLKSSSKKQTLKNIYNFITKNYSGKKQKIKLIIYPELFNHNINNGCYRCR